MTRLDDAYAGLDAAVRELLAVADEQDSADDNWTVSDYALFVGQSRITERGRIESDTSMFTPFGGDLTYQLKGLLGAWGFKLDDVGDFSYFDGDDGRGEF